MSPDPRLLSVPIPGGRIETFTIAGSPGVPLLVLGGVETGLRPLAGTESVLLRRWSPRLAARGVTVVGRPLPDDPADAERMMHPRVAADSVARAVAGGGPFAVEAESGGGRIALWLSVDHPELVSRLALAAVAAETSLGSPMAARMGAWIELAEAGRWAEFFARMAVQMRPAGEDDPGGGADSFEVAARLQPRPATPERFIGELKATLDPSSFVTERLAEIGVPALVLAGGGDQIVPLAASRRVAERIPEARLGVDPACGHTVRSSFRGYDQLVEAFLVAGDQPEN
jgi:pimeloyl-ACP methyl ester carboxylesterase